MGKNANKKVEMLIIMSSQIIVGLNRFFVIKKCTITSARSRNCNEKKRNTGQERGLKSRPCCNSKWL